MFSNKFIPASLAILIISALTACGGGDSSTTGATTNVTSFGVISKFGSLPETLQQLLPIGLNVAVGVDRSNGLVAIYIKDI